MTEDDDPEDDGPGPDDPRDGDPIDRLSESAADRDGDPFEYLADPEADEGAGSTADPRHGDPLGDEPESDVGGEPGPAADEWRDPDFGGADADESIREVEEPSVGPGEPRQGDPFDDEESAFREMDVGDRDIDAVWEDLADAEARGSVAEAAERTYAEVSKHSFCEVCEHFSGPPEVSCSHEGTEILRFVDMETVRVVDCPVVEERRELEREG